jgi:benzaldehyde dehydrogenase (NAD)
MTNDPLMSDTGREQALPQLGLLEVRDKATGEHIGSVRTLSLGEALDAIEAVDRAQPIWASVSGHERAWVLRRAAVALEHRRQEITDLVIRETGGIRRKALYEVDASLDEIHEAAGLAMRPLAEILPSGASGRVNEVQRIPVGTVAVITPWNFPFILAIRAVAPALALGNGVVLKPSSDTPIVGGRVVAEILWEAGLPEDILRVIPGPGEVIGKALAEHALVDMLHFTGSSEVGHDLAVRAAAGFKRMSFELGGNNAFIVLADADPELASAAGAWSAFYHAGQMCVGAGRHIVVRPVAERYLAGLVERASNLRVGDPADASVDVGPIVSQRQWSRVMDHIRRSREMGARVLAGGEGESPFVQPTVMADIRSDMPVWRDEVFGPVAPVLVVESDEEAIAVANDTPYGLSNAIWCGDIDRGYDLAQGLASGMVHVNGATTIDEAHMPFGGCKRSGYGGRSGGEANLEEFTQRRWISLQRRRSSASDFTFAMDEQ